MRLSHSIHLAFRQKIEREWGNSVVTQRDCIELSKDLSATNGAKVGSHTLRRFFGLVEWDGTFRKSTLDHLARYVHEANSSELISQLQSQEDLVEILVKLQVQNVAIDEYYIKKSLEEKITLEIVMMAGHMILIRLEQTDHDRTIRMLNTLKHLDEQRSSNFPTASVFAHYVAPQFHQITNDDFTRRLINETPYVNLVLGFYAPIMDLDGHFGRHIRLMLTYSKDLEHQAYGHSLLATFALQNGAFETAKKHFDSIPTFQNEHAILQGRIDILSFLIQSPNASISSCLRPPKNQEIIYFKAVMPLLIFLEKVDELDALFSAHNFAQNQTSHWLEKSAQKQIHIAQAWLFARNGKTHEAGAIIDQYSDTIWPKDYQGISAKMMELTRKEIALHPRNLG